MNQAITKEEVASLQAASGSLAGHESLMSDVEYRLKEGFVRTLKYVFLTEEEIEVVAMWAGLGTPAGVSEECRQAVMLLRDQPQIDALGMMDKERFWKAQLPYQRFLLDATRFLKKFQEPKTVVGKIALKVAVFWRDFAQSNYPDAPFALKMVRWSKHEASKKVKEMKPIVLSEVWRMVLGIRRALHNYDAQLTRIMPDQVYEELGSMKSEVEINCWSADDETLVSLFKQKRGMSADCSVCGLYSLDGYGFSFSGRGKTYCPQCIFSRLPVGGEVEVYDGGPLTPEHGGIEYQ